MDDGYLLDYTFGKRIRAEAVELLNRAKEQELEIERIPIYAIITILFYLFGKNALNLALMS